MLKTEIESRIECIESIEDAQELLENLAIQMYKLPELENIKTEHFLSAVSGVIGGVPMISERLSISDLKKLCLILLFALEYE